MSDAGRRVACDRPQGSQVTIAGLALNDHIIFDADGLTGLLAKPTRVAGATLPAQTVVRLDPATGLAEATTHPSLIDP